MDIVIHTASPFPSKIQKNESLVVRPAVEGTLAILRGVQKHKVKRVVITSSLAAVIQQESTSIILEYDENHWSKPELTHPYDKSKLLAEKAAWDYLL